MWLIFLDGFKFFSPFFSVTVVSFGENKAEFGEH